jgi:hypothetical protein
MKYNRNSTGFTINIKVFRHGGGREREPGWSVKAMAAVALLVILAMVVGSACYIGVVTLSVEPLNEIADLMAALFEAIGKAVG